MEFLFEKIRMIYEFFFIYPKSTTSMLILLSIVVIIAFLVNRRRDATGKVSFIDMTKTGVIGVRLYKTEEGSRKSNWMLPLWIPEKDLLFNVKILLQKGEYDLKAYWKAKNHHSVKDEGMFIPLPVGKEKSHSLSNVSKLTVFRGMPLEFKLIHSGKTVQIDSPDKESPDLQFDNNSFPLAISTPSLKHFAVRFESAKKSNLWELSIIDDRIITNLESEIKVITRKLDGVIVRNKKLESDLNQVVGKLKKLRKNNVPKKEAKDAKGSTKDTKDTKDTKSAKDTKDTKDTKESV